MQDTSKIPDGIDREKLQQSIKTIQECDNSYVQNWQQKETTRLAALAPYERNQLAAWNCYNPLVLKAVREGELHSVEMLIGTEWRQYAGRPELDISFNLARLYDLNQEFHDFLNKISEQIDSRDPILFSAVIKDFIYGLGDDYVKDFFAGTGIFKDCSYFFVPEYCRSLGDDIKTDQKTLYGFKSLPGLIANGNILNIENFRYKNRLEGTPGNSLKDCFEYWFRKITGDAFIDDYWKYLKGEITIEELDGIIYPDTKKKPELNEDDYTPPVTAAELAGTFGISKSSFSNRKRPLGKLFHKYADEQSTNKPCLPYDELYPPLRDAVRKSKSNKAEDFKLNSVDDLIAAFLPV